MEVNCTYFGLKVGHGLDFSDPNPTFSYIYTTKEIEECCITNFKMAFALTEEKRPDVARLYYSPSFSPRHSAAQNLGWSPNVLPTAV